MKRSGIYRIVNIVNNKCYVGSSTDVKYRLSRHKHELRNNIHINRYLQSAWNKYGESSFKFEILFYCEEGVLLKKEQKMIDYYQSADGKGYNLCPIAGNCLGIKHSEETREKMRGNTNGKGGKGKKHSKETRKKMSDARKGFSSGMKGKIHSDSTRKSMSLAKVGRKYSESAKLKMSESQKARWKIRLEEKQIKEHHNLLVLI